MSHPSLSLIATERTNGRSSKNAAESRFPSSFVLSLYVWILDETRLLFFKILPLSVWILHEILLLVFHIFTSLCLDIRRNTPSFV